LNKARLNILFVSTLSYISWGGSEMLWSDAALRLMQAGHAVSANVSGWRERPRQISALMAAGISVKERGFLPVTVRPELLRKACVSLVRRGGLRAFLRRLKQAPPDLICISSGSPADDVQMINLCVRSGVPYVLVTQANAENLWPNDISAGQMIDIFQGARRAYFVSQSNLRLLETQLGVELSNAEVIRNPFNVRWEANPPYPDSGEVVRLACVGRLDPSAKGQDLLLQVLASERWRSRPVEVSFYGTGPMEAGLRRLTERLGLMERVRFCGHENDIERVWATHQALVLPSRFEGLPLAIVEAMLCGRPVIVTDVAGNAELVEDGVTGFVAEAPTVRHLQEAMERAWTRRQEWANIGMAAARAIRERIPADPAAEFARKLLALIEGVPKFVLAKC
jgi:glycosyltransferase involved in cell wall biosynthesis